MNERRRSRIREDRELMLGRDNPFAGMPKKVRVKDVEEFLYDVEALNVMWDSEVGEVALYEVASVTGVIDGEYVTVEWAYQTDTRSEEEFEDYDEYEDYIDNVGRGNEGERVLNRVAFSSGVESEDWSVEYWAGGSDKFLYRERPQGREKDVVDQVFLRYDR